MSEVICTYDMNDTSVVIPYERDIFYKEQIEENNKTGFPTKYVSIVNALLINPEGELLLQKRSKNCGSNPGLLSKTVGGHIEYNNTPDESIQIESIQEIGVPMFISRLGNFDKNMLQIGGYINNIAIMKATTITYGTVIKILKGNEYSFGVKEHSYIGIYGGDTHFNDGEVGGLINIELESLFNDIIKNPQKYTSSFIEYIMNNKGNILEFTNRIKTILN